MEQELVELLVRQYGADESRAWSAVEVYFDNHSPEGRRVDDIADEIADSPQYW